MVERNRKNVSGQLWQALITIPLSLLHQTMPVCCSGSLPVLRSVSVLPPVAVSNRHTPF